MSTNYNLECSNKETTFGELTIGDCFFCNGNIFQECFALDGLIVGPSITGDLE